ncbi:MAG TPA: S8 family serine peptidase, partial [Pyrinomonadaceae bacterium]|nr:S8 family serine peptidase [Pyrinomonadaceae bacterium]
MRISFKSFGQVKRVTLIRTVIGVAAIALILLWIPRTTSQSISYADKPKAPRPRFIPGEILVRFKSESQAKARGQLDALQLAGRSISMRIEESDASALLEGLRVARVDPSETLAAVKALAARPDVLYAEPNYAREPFVSPNDPFYPNLWALKNTGTIFGNTGFFLPGSDIRAEEAWNITTGSRNVVVGIIDGGIDPNHPDLQPNMWVNPAEVPGNGLDDDGNGAIDDINGFDFFHNHGSFFDSGHLDSENHATHVAGIVGAVGNNGTGVVGVNWQVSLMSLKIFGRNNETPFPSNVGVLVRTYAYAKKMRDLWTTSGGTEGANIRVLNNSYGGYGRSQTELDAIRELNASGVLFVAAAGNDARNNDVFPVYPAGYESPNVISVAATGTHLDTLTNFTNVGARTVTMAAPGQTIQSTTVFGTYSNAQGTSMASPYVAGAAALICAEYPNITVDKLRSALIYNGDRVSTHDYKTLTGRRLNAFKSLNAVAENDTTAPRTIADFRIIAKDGRRITLGWSAPGDDGSVGTVSLYDLRFSASALGTPEQFEGATSISPLAIPIPSAAGVLESAVVEVPFGRTSGQIGLRATDNMGNTSPIAVVSVSIDGNVPGLYDITESQPEALSTGGTRVERFGPAYPDDGYSEFQLPFEFPYFGKWIRTATISPNGAIYFSTPPKFLLPPLTGNSIPLDAFSSSRALQTNAMIAGMWDDFYMTVGVFAVVPDADRIIFRWEGTTFNTQFDDGTSRGEHPIKFEIELRRDGTIQFRYGDGNQKLLPVVGISGGGPDAYVINSHTSEFPVFKDLTNANTVKFVPRFTAAPRSADLEISLNPPSLVTPRQAGGSILSELPDAVTPGQTLQVAAIVTALGPDVADNVVITSQLPAGLSFVECGIGITCSGPPPGTPGGTVTVTAATVGHSFFGRVAASVFSVRVNANAGATLNVPFSVTSSTPDPNAANNSIVQTIVVANYSLFNGVVAVAGNNGNAVALRQDGTVWSWGMPFGSSGCEGCGDLLPKRVLGLSDVVAIASGAGHSLALKSDGTVWSWGLNDLGQLGNQPIYLNPFHPFPPTQIAGLPNIKSIATGDVSSFALAADGSVWAWGDNQKGQIGDGTTTRRINPVRLMTIDGVRSLSTNGTCTYVIKQDGSVWSWGNNDFGLLGTGSSIPFSAVPVQVTALTNIQAISVGALHILALTNDGSVLAFGFGNTGNLGNGSMNSSTVPVQVTGLSNVTQVSAASGSMALKSDGSVWIWGDDQLTPKRVDLPSARAVATWWTVWGVILSDNTLQLWGGFNLFGILGDGTMNPRSVPGPVRTFTVVTTPSINPGGRVYVFPVDVTINCDTFDAVIHYTTNGAEPTESDPVIAAGSSLRIDRSMMLKVKAWKPGWTPSQTVSASYTVLSSSPPAMIFVEDNNPNLAVALDSVTFSRGPFRVLTDRNLSSDHHTRVLFFTSNLGLNQSDLDLISVQAAGVPLTVENVGKVSGVPGLDASFVIVRLPDGLPS